jgi:hypothetical protein
VADPVNRPKIIIKVVKLKSVNIDKFLLKLFMLGVKIFFIDKTIGRLNIKHKNNK